MLEHVRASGWPWRTPRDRRPGAALQETPGRWSPGDGALEGASCPRRGALRQLAACVVGVVAHSGRAIGDSAIGDSAVEELLGSMDADGDGAVSLEEWRAVVRPACCALAADAKGLGDEGVAGDLRRPDAEGLADVAGNGWVRLGGPALLGGPQEGGGKMESESGRGVAPT